MSNNASFPPTGFVRLPSIIGPGKPIPVSKSTWWEGVRSGRYPKPVKLGPRITAWRVEDIRALIRAAAAGELHDGGALKLAEPGAGELSRRPCRAAGSAVMIPPGACRAGTTS